MNIEEIVKEFMTRIKQEEDPKYLNELKTEIKLTKLKPRDKTYLYTEIEFRKYDLSSKYGLR